MGFMAYVLHDAVLANVGQVVKNLFLDSCLLVYCYAGGLEVNGEEDRTKLGELRSRTIMDAG